MKIQLLREFVTLAQMLNFTKAAQKLHITQPVLSRHIKELEEQFGTELLYRDKQSVELTSSGKLLLDEAHKILEQYEKSFSTIKNFTGQSRYKLSIAYLGEAFNHILSEVIENYQQKYPNVTISYRDCEIDEAIDFLKLKEYDLGFVLRSNLMEKFEGFDSITFLTDPLCIAVNKEHPLASYKEVSLAEVAKWPNIRVNPQEFPLSAAYSTDFFRKHGLSFTIYKEYCNLKTCFFNLEMNKQAVLLTPKHRLYLLGKNSKLIDVVETDYFYKMELIWNPKSNNPCIYQFIKEFKRFLEK